MIRATFILLALATLGCGTVPPDDEDPDPPPKSRPCEEPTTTEEFSLGVMVFDNPRWFRAFGEECNTLEVQSGLQGGWHTEPALQAPRDATVDDLGGELRWELRDEDGNVLTNEARFEMFRNFWQELEGGNAYWGDFVIFTQYPEDAVGSDVTLEVTLDFDDESTLDDRVLTRTVQLLDDE